MCSYLYSQRIGSGRLRCPLGFDKTLLLKIHIPDTVRLYQTASIIAYPKRGIIPHGLPLRNGSVITMCWAKAYLLPAGPVLREPSGERQGCAIHAGAARRAEIERRVTLHVLRHTFSTRFIQKRGDLATLRAILGHTSIATMSRYLHPNATQMQNMVEE
jgi:integrase